MRARGKSDIGQIRKINEDTYLILEGTAACLYAVADGMGGHRSGEVASQMAINVLRDYFKELLEEHHPSEEWEDHLRTAFVQANRKVLNVSMENDQHNGMGTTLTAVICEGDDLYIAHIGDSRMYMIYPDEIKKVTDDHSLVGELLRQGEITAEKAKTHPQKNILLKALGVEMAMEVSFYHRKIEAAEFLLLTTDGLTNLVSDTEMMKMAQTMKVEEALETLIDTANLRGGNDNITAILVKITSDNT